MTNARKNDPKMLSTNYFWELYQKWDDAGKNTIWGVAQSNYAMPERGIIAVSTASHGGIMMEQAYARRLLSPRGYALGAQSCEKGCKGWLFYEEDIDECIVLYELLERGEPEFSICAALRYDYRGAGELRRSLETSLARHYEPYIKYMEARRKRLQNNRRKAHTRGVRDRRPGNSRHRIRSRFAKKGDGI